MKCESDRLLTPIYVKTDPDLPWPENESAFYVLSRDGLFLCRDHPMFRSCVPARTYPGELEAHRQFLKLRCPKVPREPLERIIGFFRVVAERDDAEAAAVLLWDRETREVSFRVPEQRAVVVESWTGHRHGTSVSYDMPELPPGLSVFGTIHSHVDGAAYSSHTDREDESHMAGLHIVVGRVRSEPPEVHCEYVVDGVRFRVDPQLVLEGYERADPTFPDEWLSRVRIDVSKPRDTYYHGSQH